MDLLYTKTDWPDLSPVLYIILIAVLVFLIIREVICWYLKINKRVELLTEQNLLLKKIFEQLGGEIIDKNSPNNNPH